MHKLFFLLFGVLNFYYALAQTEESITLKIVSLQQEPLSNATVEVLGKDSSLLKIGVSDTFGVAQFNNLALQEYLIRVTLIGYKTSVIAYRSPNQNTFNQIVLEPENNTLQNI